MVVTVHDLSPLHFPQFCPPAARAYPDLVKKAVSRGAWVHADSEFVAQEVVEALGAPPERVRAVHLGVTPPARPSGADDWRKLLPDWVGSYVLALGRVEPRKDLPTLVRAFGQLRRQPPGPRPCHCRARRLGLRATERGDIGVGQWRPRPPVGMGRRPGPRCPDRRRPPSSPTHRVTRASASRLYRPWPAAPRWWRPPPER